MLGGICAWSLFIDPEYYRKLAVDRNGDSPMELMQGAASEARMTSITFVNRKWYAGYVAEAQNRKPKEVFKLLPLISGYRDSKLAGRQCRITLPIRRRVQPGAGSIHS